MFTRDHNRTQCSREKRVKIPGLDAQGFNLILGDLVNLALIRNRMPEPYFQVNGINLPMISTHHLFFQSFSFSYPTIASFSLPFPWQLFLFLPCLAFL